MSGLGRLEGRGKGFLIPDFAHQSHIGVYPQGRPQGFVESEGVQPHFLVPDEGLAALVHEPDGSSIVRMWRASLRSIQSMIAARVVLLPGRSVRSPGLVPSAGPPSSAARWGDAAAPW